MAGPRVATPIRAWRLPTFPEGATRSVHALNGLGALMLLSALVAMPPASAAPLSPRVPVLRASPMPFRGLPRRRGFRLRPFVGRRGFGSHLPPSLLPLPPPDTFLQPEGPSSSPLLDGAPGNPPPLSHGFHLSVKIGAGQTFAAPKTLDRFIEVAQALGACFSTPQGLSWGSITLRVSFRRDGSVFGVPTIPYSDAATADQKSDLAHSLLAGLKRCTPLPLSPSLGAAVAGEIFAIRFIHEDKT